jgi:diphthamide biosynthesis enzyme Dph1/Dph2-like protein
MKILFIPAKQKTKFNDSLFNEIKRLPNNLAICYSIQYKDLAEKIKDNLKNKKITLFTQVLGCSNPKFPKETKAILIIGEGRFHSVSLEYESGMPVYLLEGNKLHRVDPSDVKKMKNNEKAAYANYLHQDKIGILVTHKPGQKRLKGAIEFKKKLKGKKAYLFLSNEINVSEFENFDLKSWVNTACPRMDLNDNRIININSIKS